MSLLTAEYLASQLRTRVLHDSSAGGRMRLVLSYRSATHSSMLDAIFSTQNDKT